MLLSAAIDSELAGAYPLHRIRIGLLLNESVAVLVHALLVTSVMRAPRLLWKSARAKRWATDGRCVRCGYDLSGVADECPECGTPRTEPVRPGSIDTA